MKKRKSSRIVFRQITFYLILQTTLINPTNTRIRSNYVRLTTTLPPQATVIRRCRSTWSSRIYSTSVCKSSGQSTHRRRARATTAITNKKTIQVLDPARAPLLVNRWSITLCLTVSSSSIRTTAPCLISQATRSMGVMVRVASRSQPRSSTFRLSCFAVLTFLKVKRVCVVLSLTYNL